ncbi:hypothetical protein JXA47_15085 [Candidatus Sumerlaeota bacterium]|nr:hypothetical protein [Candidatus Sumerlaeota bacterium]
MDFLTDPLYGLLMAVIVFVVGVGLVMKADNKWGYLVAVIGLYWVWIVVGAQDWGIPGPPWTPIR